ncbi:MAG: asparaginase [Planctomycetota bacterium]
MSPRRVYVVYTGGTIGMRWSPLGYRPAPGFLEQLAGEMPELHSPDFPSCQVNEYSPLLDSSEMTPANWVEIAGDIARNHDRYDGFVVLHGTDTLAYTASALSFMLLGLKKPVIVTGSQLPLCEVTSDGRHNLITALLLAGKYDIPEVCVYFDGRLLRGNRTIKVSADQFGAFDSPNYPPLGRIGTRIEIRRNLLLQPIQDRLHLQEIGSANVAALRLFPGIDASLLRNILQPPLQGLVLECYGVGNAPVRNLEFLGALERAYTRGVVVVDITQCSHGSVHLGDYSTSSPLADAGVISGHDMTAEAALAKLYYLFERKLSPDQVREEMGRSLCGELTRE